MAAIAILAIANVPLAHAETLNGALVRAYAGNPTLDAQRAAQRATDENVPRAIAGYRPSISAIGNAGFSFTEGVLQGNRVRRDLNPTSYGLQVQQNLFNG